VPLDAARFSTVSPLVDQQMEGTQEESVLGKRERPSSWGARNVDKCYQIQAKIGSGAYG
jgi:hypothetical protein